MIPTIWNIGMNYYGDPDRDENARLLIDEIAIVSIIISHALGNHELQKDQYVNNCQNCF